MFFFNCPPPPNLPLTINCLHKVCFIVFLCAETVNISHDLSPGSTLAMPGDMRMGGSSTGEYSFSGSGSTRSQTQGWMNTLSNRSTLSKKSSSGGTGGGRSRNTLGSGNFVKDYIKRRNLILSLVVSCFW